ncbi:hypothetical protein MASR2M15_24280 [Anaerolineales bacterium]
MTLDLTLFFSHDVSLKIWQTAGILERETALYKKFVEWGATVRFISYGGREDAQIARSIPEIKVYTNRLGLKPELYRRYLHRIHSLPLWRTKLIKTNQTPGGQAALIAHRIWGKPLIARCGYMHSDFMINQFGADSPQADAALKLESQLFSSARTIIVTTPMMQASIIERLPLSENRIHVILNYVDTALFRPLASEVKYDLIYIGRFQEQKNLDQFIEALYPLNIRVAMVGTGPLEERLQRQATGATAHIDWLGRLPQTRLPELIAQSRIYALPSLYEGHPKSLIEAMACGVCVLGTDVEGIRQVITHGQNGYLSQPDASHLRESIQHLLAQDALRSQLGQAALAFSLQHYSLESIATQEFELLQQLL